MVINMSNSKVQLNKTLYCNDVIELQGEFIFDNERDIYIQKVKQNYDGPAWMKFDKIEIKFPNNDNDGVYKEYYKSGKLRRQIPFICGDNDDDFYAHGIETLYYEDKDSEGNDTYTILEENEFRNMEKVGISKKYSIDGGLLSEQFNDEIIDLEDGFYGMKYKEYHNSNGALALIEEKDWGKAYYENGELKAEWTNINYRKDGQYREYHENGELKMEVNYKNGIRYGIMNKYLPDGKQKEKWSYTNDGKRIFVNKYFNNGRIKSEWNYENGELIQKIEFDKNGNKK